MDYNIETILNQMLTKKEQNNNLYNRAVRADDTLFQRNMANRQMANQERATNASVAAQDAAVKQQAQDNEMDWTDWAKLGVGALSTILAIPTGGASTMGGSLINMLIDAGKKKPTAKKEYEY